MQDAMQMTQLDAALRERANESATESTDRVEGLK